jgi:hypothetical protein
MVICKKLTQPMTQFCHIRKQSFIFFILVFFSVAMMSSCNKTKEDTVSEKINDTHGTGVHKTYERGPVSVRIDIDKKNITIAERLNLTISIISDEAYDVKLPGFGEKLDQFGIVDYHTSQPELTEDSRSKISRSYILEPFLSGEYVIAPMKVFFMKKKSSDDPDQEIEHEIETEEITVHVTSLLPENFEQLTLHDIKPPENLPQSYDLWLWGGILCGFALFSGIAVIVIIRKRKKSGNETAANKIPAHLQAFDELNALVSENLVEKGEIKAFYQKISDIVRRYIENRFNIKAPEQTTEEFLAGIQMRNDFKDTYKSLLKNFLTHCDLVKFARHQPETNDIQNTFDSSKEFILGTKEEE